MEYNTLKCIINAFNVTSKDDTKYHICHVLLTAAGENVTIVATDGRCLSDVVVQDTDLAALILDKKYLVHADSLDSLKSLAKQFKNSFVKSELDGETIVLKGTAFNVKIETTESLNVEFPDYKAVYPKYDSEPLQFSFNAQYLFALAKALSDGPKDQTITFRVKDKLSPIKITMQDGKVGLLMPVRI